MELNKEISDWLDETVNYGCYQELINKTQKNIEINSEKERMLRLFFAMGYLAAVKELTEYVE